MREEVYLHIDLTIWVNRLMIVGTTVESVEDGCVVAILQNKVI